MSEALPDPLVAAEVEKKRRPAFQFYPADWRKDVELRSCSVAARGLWIDMLCIAHECEPYGHLTVNGHAMRAEQVANQVGLTPGACKRLLDELIANGVARKTPEGVIYSKRMVEDERIRNARAEGGKAGSEHGAKGAEHGAKGGRPKNETGDKKPPSKPPSKPPLKPPPSSSSSSSSSEETPPTTSEPPAAEAAATPRGARLPRDWALPRAWGDWALGEYPLWTAEKVRLEGSKFRDHWAAKPGKAGTSLDWLATWRNWCRSDIAHRDDPKPLGQGRSAAAPALDFEAMS